MPWAGLQSMIVVFPDHTHLHFCKGYHYMKKYTLVLKISTHLRLLIVFSALIEVQNILVAGTYTLKFMVVDHCGDTGVVTIIVTVTKEVRPIF